MSDRDGRWANRLSGWFDGPDMVPMQHGEFGKNKVPREIAALAYEEYSGRYGTSQSFERLLERGGFSSTEIIAHLADLVERERRARKVAEQRGRKAR